MVREDLYARDLRDIVNRFDSDERFVLAKNFPQFLSERRPVSPLLLPRQYYIALPDRPQTGAPRPPPKNCFVDLFVADDAQMEIVSDKPDRFCAYFVPDRTGGTYLYFAFVFVDDDLVLHEIGDNRLNADAIRLSVNYGDKFSTWTVLPQSGKNPKSPDRFPITAYVDVGARQERDKRIEGWAYRRSQDAVTQIVTILGRIDFKAIDADFAKPTELDWPPKEFSNIRIQLSRKNVSSNREASSFVPYADTGTTNLSVQSLYSTSSAVRGSFLIRQKDDAGQTKTWRVTPIGVVLGDAEHLEPWIRQVDGDLIISGHSPTSKFSVIPDTNLSLEIIHPGFVIEKGIWQTVVLLVIFLGVFLWWAFWFIRKTLVPINRMAKHAKALAGEAADPDKTLSYSKENNEIGTLSRAYNELLNRTREQAKREHEDRIEREVERHRRELEDLRVREVSLKTIGHEIRAPLQALLAIHRPGDKAHRYVERMMRAVEYLFGSTGPEAGFAAMQLHAERVDVASFVAELTGNAPLAGIENVIYVGPNGQVFCNIDSGALEDAITHILMNANRFRVPGTPVTIRLEAISGAVLIHISNVGPRVDADKIAQIFELGVTVGAGGELGQGLFVARSHIRKLGGDVSVRNLESGVEFTIRLPYAPVKESSIK